MTLPHSIFLLLLALAITCHASTSLIDCSTRKGETIVTESWTCHDDSSVVCTKRTDDCSKCNIYEERRAGPATTTAAWSAPRGRTTAPSVTSTRRGELDLPRRQQRGLHQEDGRLLQV